MSDILNLPKSISICEKSIREGLGSEEKFIPTEAKLFLANVLIEAGCQKLEMSVFNTEFSPDVPQFQDIDVLLRKFGPSNGVERYCLAQDKKAITTAIKAKEAGYGPEWISLTIDPKPDSPMTQFQNRTTDESVILIENSVKLAEKAGIKICIVITPSWTTNIKNTIKLVDQLVNAGIKKVIHADPDGKATPLDTFNYCSEMLARHPDIEHFLHHHDHKGFGISNYLAAMQAGIKGFDTCLGGIGGFVSAMMDGIPIPIAGMGDYQVQPGRKTGLVCTEDFIFMCNSMEINTGIDVDKLLTAGRWLEKIIGRNLWSFSLRAAENTAVQF